MRRWDDNKGKSYAMRSKENAQDYRYFPEPDIPPISISDEEIEKLKKNQPELADAKKARYMENYALSDYDASIITGNKNLADLFENTVKICGEAKETANWILGQVMYLAGDKGMELDDVNISPKVFADFVTLIAKGSVNRKIGRDIFELVFEKGEDFDVNKYVADNNLAMVEDTGEIESVVKKIISENPASIEDYKAGKTRVVGFLIGQCMKALKGKANPSAVSELVNKELAKL